MIEWKKSALALVCVAAIGGLGACDRPDGDGDLDDIGDHPSKPTGEMTGDEATGAGDMNDGVGASGQLFPGGTPEPMQPPSTTTDFGGAEGTTDFGGVEGSTDFGGAQGSTDFGGANGHDLGSGSGSTATPDDRDDTPRPGATTQGFEDTPGARGTGTGSDTTSF